MPATSVRCSLPTFTSSFRSFFDFSTLSAVITFAVRSSTFMKSSIEIRSVTDGAGVAVAPSVESGLVGAGTAGI